MQRTGVVERCVLEDQTTKVTVSGDDVVSLFLLTELVTIVLGLSFGGFTNQRRGNQRTVHCTEQRTTEDTSDTQHVEGVHQDVVLCLEDQHVVEGATDTQGHCVRERTLTERIDQEHCTRCSNRCAISNTDPRTHTETVREFPLTTHVSIDADQEVEDYKLERTTVVQPFIKGSSFPDGVEVETDCVGTRDDSPEMMLLPYMREPATGSRIPSMSTGGAAMNATMKQMVAANRVGIISTPNQPT